MADKLTTTELRWLTAIFNGVHCSPYTFIGNVRGAILWSDCSQIDVDFLLEKLEGMSIEEISRLHYAIQEFWNTDGYYIADFNRRMKEVGLL